MNDNYKLEQIKFKCPTIGHTVTITFKNYPIESRPTETERPDCLDRIHCPITKIVNGKPVTNWTHCSYFVDFSRPGEPK